MAHIRTIEDGYQYRMHQILNKIAVTTSLPIEVYLNTRDGKIDLAEAVLTDIEEYCGLEECIDNEY